MSRKMKDSGVEWIGEIPEQWGVVRIGNQYTERKTKVSDKDFRPLSVTMKGILPQLSTAAKSDAHDDRKLVCKGDFAINSRSDRRGSCGISPCDGSVSLINTILCPRDEMNPRYYNWLFHTSMFADEYYRWGHGIVNDLWTTNWQDMKKIGIPEPSLEEQEKIADYLDKQCSDLDTVIAKTRESIGEYKKLKQSVITQAVTKGVCGERPMKDSENEWIGEIPEDWDVTKVKFISNLVTDGAHVSPETENGVYDFISTTNVGGGEIDFKTCLKTSDESYRQLVSNGCKPEKNDVLISKDGTVGKTVIVDFEYDFVVASSLVIIRPNLDLISSEFLNYNLQSKHVQDLLLMLMHGAGLKRVSVEKNANLPIVLVSLEEQEEIVTYLDEKCAAIDSLITQKEQYVAELESYKKSLIYEYVTGKKEVSNV